VLDDLNNAHSAGPDLSQAVTVYVTTVGAPTFAACMAHLREQDCRFPLHVIDHVAPMTAAFQRMLDTCRTPYYVQVDEDMLLYPHAVRALYERIEATAPNVALYAADLYDVHLERCIIGVKIFRHEIVRRYPLVSVDGFETRQVAELLADGYRIMRAEPGISPVDGQTLGMHGTGYTPELIYERYANLERRRRTHHPPQLHWFGEYPETFLKRFLEEPSEKNFFALMGVVAGVLASRHGKGKSKDYRSYSGLPGFQALRAFLADCERSTPESVAACSASVERPRIAPSRPAASPMK